MAKVLLRNFTCSFGRQLGRNFKHDNWKVHKKYHIKMIDPESYTTAVEFMKKHFADDPLSIALRAAGTKDYKNLLQFVWSSEIKEGLSLQASSLDTNRIIGLIVNVELNEHEKVEKYRQISDKCKLKATKNLINAWHEFRNLSKSKTSDISKEKSVFHISGVAVSKDYQAMGIAKRLLIQSLCKAKCRGYNLASINCTSEFLAKAAKSVGFECVNEKPFEEFKGLVSVKEPHTHVKVCVRRLDGFLV